MLAVIDAATGFGLGIPAGEVFLTVVNHAVVDLNAAIVSDGDYLSLYPPIGGG